LSLTRRRVLVACSVVGVATAVLTVVTVQPVTQKDTPRQTITSNVSPVRPKAHHRVYATLTHTLLSGVGSWYGDLFDGRATASGELFDKAAFTACHPTLPFGTLVRVINLRNRRSVVVRINDRGIRPDRVIDLSSAAAEKIGLLETGIAPVRLEVLSKSRS